MRGASGGPDRSTRDLSAAGSNFRAIQPISDVDHGALAGSQRPACCQTLRPMILGTGWTRHDTDHRSVSLSLSLSLSLSKPDCEWTNWCLHWRDRSSSLWHLPHRDRCRHRRRSPPARPRHRSRSVERCSCRPGSRADDEVDPACSSALLSEPRCCHPVDEGCVIKICGRQRVFLGPVVLTVLPFRLVTAFRKQMTIAHQIA
jgi:hypothetical protein